MKNLKGILESAVAGAAITLVSGMVQSTPGGLVGAAWYGWPVTWVRRLVIAPQYNPWVVDWYGLVIDFVFWFVVALIVWYIIHMLTNKKSASTTSKRKK